MISTMTTLAPSVVLTTGSLAARPAARAIAPTAARLRVLPPIAPCASEVFGIAPIGGQLDGTAVPTTAEFGAPAQSKHQNDDTTPGIHPPGRRTS